VAGKGGVKGTESGIGGKTERARGKSGLLQIKQKWGVGMPE